MKGLFVDGNVMELDKNNHPFIQQLNEALFPGQYKLHQYICNSFPEADYVDCLDDYVKVAAKRSGRSVRSITRRLKVESFKSVKRSGSFKSDKQSGSFKSDKGKEEVSYKHNNQDEDNQDEDDQDEDDQEEEDDEDEQDKTPSFSESCSALKSIGSVMACVDPESDPEYYWRLKNAALPFIAVIESEFKTEDEFGASERAEQLGLDSSQMDMSRVGKRAMELFREIYPNIKPAQRSVKSFSGRWFLMNLYTKKTAPRTLDVALKEASKKRQRE